MNGIEVTAVIPVYNDRRALEKAIPVSLEALSGITDRFEIIVAEDGSTDGSSELAGEMAANDPRIRHSHSDERLGRGRALNRAIREARGRIVCFYDVDLATDISHLPELIRKIREGSDIAIGSRLMPGSEIVRSVSREIPSRVYNFFVRLLLGSPLHDHQCGFKAFDRNRVLELIPSVRDTHFFWDTELLVRAQRRGYRIVEIPVRWREGRGTTVRLHDVWSMGASILRLWWSLHVSKD